MAEYHNRLKQSKETGSVKTADFMQLRKKSPFRENKTAFFQNKTAISGD
ncbi:MAG: hypothetical protein MR791_04415 [Bacteroidales bacterium]|nr:hypothetical protein [Bacteroidales bacterium]